MLPQVGGVDSHRAFRGELEDSAIGVPVRVKKAGTQLAKVFEDIQKKAEQTQATGGAGTPFAEITDEDIDNLFSV